MMLRPDFDVEYFDGDVRSAVNFWPEVALVSETNYLVRYVFYFDRFENERQIYV